jgi:hypothetical protein
MFADELDEIEKIEMDDDTSEPLGSGICLECGYPLASLDCACDLKDRINGRLFSR